MGSCTDILQVIPDEDIPKLRELYKNRLPETVQAYNFLKVAIEWKKKRPDKNYMTVMAPYGKWQDGTFVAVMEFSCYDFFIYTLEESCESLCRALSETKLIKWNIRTFWVAVQENHCTHLVKHLKSFGNPVDENYCHIWWISKEKALQYEIEVPNDVYIGKLERSHVEIMNEVWPHRYDGSIEFLSTFVEMNGGFGLFIKGSNELAAWILKSQIGGLAILQTAEAHKRKGYASLITKVLSKKLAEEGLDAFGTVLHRNGASQAMFTKLGFKQLGTVVFVESLGQELDKIM